MSLAQDSSLHPDSRPQAETLGPRVRRHAQRLSKGSVNPMNKVPMLIAALAVLFAAPAMAQDEAAAADAKIKAKKGK